MKFLKAYIKIINNINDKVGYAVSWLTLLLVLIVCYDVISRYLFMQGSVALQELEWHIFSILFLMAAAYTLKMDEHVRVDVIYTKFNPQKKAWINLLGSILFLIPFCIIIIISSKDFVLTSFKLNEMSPDSGGLPARYILKAFIPISFFFLMLQGFALAFKSIVTIKEKSFKENI